ncbi:phosphotransferase [Pseudooceanicola nanhaiensis]|uniref:phosphotransferase n=1 Tax=Pseudooceanicola nanhaiensis TaxID=375761 RepID=UPI001CD5E7D0|nr:phosphotransferase [Pseudooceanicola nanhaiensis]MCA0921589.1 phosphotransferase [Pseudooceanicola nanhaiensis]
MTERDAALTRALELAGQGGLATDFTRLTAEEAAAICRDLYGMEGSLDRLDTEKDDTFRLTTDQGRFILKVANPDEAESELDLQLAALRHLEETGFPIDVPRAVPLTSGGYIARLAGSDRMVRMMTYVEGEMVEDAGLDATQRYHYGRALAELRLALATFSHPAQARVLAWDVRHAGILRPLLTQIETTPERVALAEAVFDRLAALQTRIDALPRQVVHNDFRGNNLVGDPAAPQFITGIIDFGDVVETAVAIDLSTAVMNQMLREFPPEADIFAPSRAVVEGYAAHAPIGEEELAMVPHLVMARVLLRAVMNEWRAALMPSNREYILRNSGPSWGQLGWFIARPVEEISALLLPRPT